MNRLIQPGGLFTRRLFAAAMLLGALPAAAHAQWVASGSNIYYSAGNVGIGTNSPYAALTTISNTAPGAIGILGVGHSLSSLSVGVRGTTYAGDGYGGIFDGGQFGLYSQSVAPGGNTVGVWGQVTSPDGWGGVFKGGRWGVWGEADGPGRWAGYFVGRGFFSGSVGIGTATPLYPLHVESTQITVIAGICDSTAGTAGAGVAGVMGMTTSSTVGAGVAGISEETSGLHWGVAGVSNSPDGVGTKGNNLAASGASFGVLGTVSSTSGYGVAGSASASVGVNYGVIGQSNSLTDGWGVYAEGNMGCSGTKNFNIDHPLDPAHKYLNHFSAEGPEALLIYRGNVTLDPSGEAWVTLPSYFESINRDLTYQLTPVGAPAPALYIASEVKDNRFMVAGGSPGLKVSWTVTGVRNDAYVRAYPKPVEQDKPAELVGKYLHPQLFGQPETLGIFYKPSIANEVGVASMPTGAQSEAPAFALPEPVVPASPVNQRHK